MPATPVLTCCVGTLGRELVLATSWRQHLDDVSCQVSDIVAATCGTGIVLRIHLGQAAKQVLICAPHFIPVCKILVWVVALIHLHQAVSL